MLAQGKSTDTKETLRSELEASRLAFHALLDWLSKADLKKQSLNAGWTNEELLFHMALAFFVLTSLLPLARLFGHLPKAFSHPLAQMLNGCTRPFNWINALGTRLGGRVMTSKSLGKTFDWANAHLVKALYTFSDEDWQRCGMYAPTRWDAVSFKDYMTLEDLFRMPLLHFNFHLKQIARETTV
jgi:DinB family protein